MNATNGKTYWRSLNELQDTPEFRQMLEREFPVAASEFPDGVSRRRWMQLMGASLAFGGLAGCRWQAEKIAPMAMRPENRVPGEPEHFATSIEIGNLPRHLLVTCYDGRPIKVEGNPDHAASRGASDAFSQASILGLYDPDRSDALRQRDGSQVFTRSWDDFQQFADKHFAAIEKRAGEGLAILLEPTSSITSGWLLERFRERFPKVKSYAYAAISNKNEAEGTRLAFGRPLRARLDLTKANVIASFDADLIGLHPNSIAHLRDFTGRRDPKKNMNRLYAVESQFTVTGAAADHRLATKSADIGELLVHIDRLVRERLLIDTSDVTTSLPEDATRFAEALADDLVKNRGRSVVVVGRTQPAEVHAIAHDLNATLENIGETVLLTDDPSELPAESLNDLVTQVQQGRVDTLLIMGGNPVHDAPGEFQLSDLLPNIPTTIRSGLYEDETSQHCTWHLPEAHAFESWGDVRSWDGTICVTQPLITPLLGGKSQIELLSMVCGVRRHSRELVRHAISQATGQVLSPDRWACLVHDGLLEGSALPIVDAKLQLSPKRDDIVRSITSRSDVQLELVFVPSDAVFDGRLANIGWLQETPDFLTKLTWDNAAILSPETAKLLGVEHEQFVSITSGSSVVELPVFVLPGQAPGSIGLALGYGRTAAGLVGGKASEGVPPVGFNVCPLRRWNAEEFTTEFDITPIERTYKFATTQDHHAIDTVGMEETGRRVGQLVREATLDKYKAHPDFAQHATHHPPLESLWEEPSHDGHAWGMSIDLNKCIGCNACMVACQSENNVPIVGKEQVAMGREMHWLRVDRYFTGEVASPEVAIQPVACQQCENAPCEQVCPVAATVHSDEGLNDMVYNRCIGTRYCANNCPYKVRRFNFFDYNEQLEEPNRQLAQLVINPEVTVRSRGVMEKCTYCVQRIQSTKISAKNEQRSIRDGELMTACQQACPAQAIEFGDLNDPSSRVAKSHSDPRAYGMLSELNVKPRTKYLARIRNLNPALSDHRSTNHHASDRHHGHS